MTRSITSICTSLHVIYYYKFITKTVWTPLVTRSSGSFYDSKLDVAWLLTHTDIRNSAFQTKHVTLDKLNSNY